MRICEELRLDLNSAKSRLNYPIEILVEEYSDSDFVANWTEVEVVGYSPNLVVPYNSLEVLLCNAQPVDTKIQTRRDSA